MAEAVAKIIVGIGAVTIVLIIAPLVGGLVGWLFALVFDDSFDTLCKLLRVDATGFQLGAALGFLGAFFRSTVTTK